MIVKKKFILFVFLMMFLIPFQVDAAAITSVTMGSVTEQEEGSSFYVPVYVNFSGIDKNSVDTYGIYTIAMDLDFDDDSLIVTDIVSDFYESVIYQENGQYIILSAIDEDAIGNKCADQFLACSNYEMKVQFYVKKDAKDISNISIHTVVAGVLKVNSTLEYHEEDIEMLEYSNVATRAVSIKKTQNSISEEPNKSVVLEGEAPTIKHDTIEKAVEEKKQHTPANSNNTVNTSKSSNANLASLSIKDYSIDFKKETLHYDIIIDNDVTSLDIQAQPEDGKATYQVIGAGDLKDEVKIVVKAESGHEITYTIGIKRKQMVVPENEKEEEKGIFDKVNHVALYVAGGVAVVIVLCFLISHHNGRKLDKMLKDL